MPAEFCLRPTWGARAPTGLGSLRQVDPIQGRRRDRALRAEVRRERIDVARHGLHIGAATAAGGADACELTTADPQNPRLPWDNVFISIPAVGTA